MKALTRFDLYRKAPPEERRWEGERHVFFFFFVGGRSEVFKCVFFSKFGWKVGRSSRAAGPTGLNGAHLVWCVGVMLYSRGPGRNWAESSWKKINSWLCLVIFGSLGLAIAALRG